MKTPSPEYNTTPQPEPHDGAALRDDLPDADSTATSDANSGDGTASTRELAPLPETQAVPGETDDTTEVDEAQGVGGTLHDGVARQASAALPPHTTRRRLPRVTLPVWDDKVRRLQLTGLLLSLFVCGMMSLYVLNFAQRNDAEREVWAGLPLWKSIENWEYSLYNERFVQRGVIKPKSHDKIAIIAINQSSFTALGTWPWPRSYHAKVIRRLKKAGARVIAVDINFSEKQLPIVDEKTGAFKELSAYDKDLIAATAEAGNVIYPAAFRYERKTSGGQATINFITSPFEELDTETADVALNFLPLDPDDGARRYGVRGKMSGEDLGSFSSLAVAMFQNKLDGNENTAYYKLLKSNVWPDAEGVLHQIPVSETRFGDNRIWTTPFHYWGPAGTFDTYSFSDVKEQLSDARLKQIFGGRIVFIGATIELLEDLFKVPSFVSAPQTPGPEYRTASMNRATLVDLPSAEYNTATPQPSRTEVDGKAAALSMTR